MDKKFDESLERFRFNSKRALAESAYQKAKIEYDFHGRLPKIFTHKGHTYHAYHKGKDGDKQIAVERISRATFHPKSSIVDISNPDRPDYSLQLEIVPIKKPGILTIASARDLATQRGLKEFCLARAGISFEGGSHAATAFATYLTSKRVPEVFQLSITGFSKETSWYFFKYFGIDPQGKLHFPDKQGLYKVGHKKWYRSAVHDSEKTVEPTNKRSISVKNIHALITGAWGPQGAAAFAWVVASWFVGQIKQDLNWFPFVSLAGSPGSGKSALALTLNRIQGHDGEGLPVTTLNTKLGLANTVSRTTLFSAILENNDRDQSSFDAGIILTGYNSNNLRVQALPTPGNQTAELPFPGSLMFVQNIEPFSTQAEKERVISLHFDVSQLTDETRQTYEQLHRIPKNQLARTIIEVLQKREFFESNWHQEYESSLLDLSEVGNRRIQQNHALILAFHRLICKAFDIPYPLSSYLLDIAKKKEISSRERDYDLADYFFEALALLDESDTQTLCAVHADESKNHLYIHLSGAVERLKTQGVQIFVNRDLTQALANHPACEDRKQVFRFPKDIELSGKGRAKTKRVFRFTLSKI